MRSEYIRRPNAMKNRVSGISAALWTAAAFVLTGCASTDYARTSNPATITEQRTKLDSGPKHWGVNRIYRVGEIELGLYRARGAQVVGGTQGVAYKVDAGQTDIWAWYYDNTSGSYKANQTAVTKLTATLRPNGRYELRSTRDNGKLQFSLYDVDAASTIAESAWTEIQARPLPEQPGNQEVFAFPGHIHLWR